MKLFDKIVGCLILAVMGLTLAAVLTGCTSSVTGGQARHDTASAVLGGHKTETAGFLDIETFPDGRMVIHDTRRTRATSQPSTVNSESIATTQPSATSNNGAAPRIGASSEGELGSFSFDQVKRPPATSWPLIGLLLVVGVGFYLVRNWYGVALCGAGILLAFVYPVALVWIALAAVGWVLWSHRAALAQVVRGNDRALASLAPIDASLLKTHMASKQDTRVQRVVRAIKGS